MTKDDYFVLVNRFLSYLYKCLRQNIAPDWNLLTPSAKDLPVHEEYFAYMLAHLLTDGYIEGITEVRRIGSPVRFKEASGLEITPAGIEYLEENSTIERVTELPRPANEIAGTILSKFW